MAETLDCGHDGGMTDDGVQVWYIAPCGHTVCEPCTLSALECPICGGTSFGTRKVFPLHEAAQQGNCEAIGLLLKKGWEVDQENGLGYTALLLAVAHDHLEAAELLAAAGANTMLGERGLDDTPLEVAAQGGSNEFSRCGGPLQIAV
ncbi:MAG: ankyrin repeat domain-containing protein, partial [Planctomycetota bacterium]